MKKYRVMFNGIDYRVQWLGKTFILRRLKWYWLRQYNYAGDFISTFSSRKAAQEAIDKCIVQDKAEKQGYISVSLTEMEK